MLCVVANPAEDATLVVDRLEPGTIHRPREVVRLPGGKGVNVARAATALGARARVLALLPGADAERFGAALETEGIAVASVAGAASLRRCNSVVDAAAGTLTEFYEHGADPGPAAWERFTARVRAELMPAEPLVLAGSLPPGVEPRSLATLAGDAVVSGAEVVIDAGGAVLAALAGAPVALVKVNEHEAAELLGTVAAGPDDGAALALAEGVRAAFAEATTAIVTRGERGAVLAAPDRTLAASIDAPPGKFPVGSGDAFLAGFLSTEGREPADRLAAAIAAGAANAALPGAGRLDADHARRLRERVRVDDHG